MTRSAAPHVERFTPPGAGSLLICSDGLSNYMAESASLAGLALPQALTDPLGAAGDMVQFRSTPAAPTTSPSS